MTDNNYALVRELPDMDYDAVVARVTELLAGEGFGVLTEIDVKATLKKKIDVDFKRYVILGACNPTMAHQALSMEPDIGVLLPCNVIVRQTGDSVTVEAMDPGLMATVTNNEEMAKIGAEARELVNTALERLTTPSELDSGE